MSVRAHVLLAVAWLFSLAAVAAYAQRGVAPVRPPVVISGADIGFRVEGQQGATLVGTIVIRVNGAWVEPKVLPRPTIVASR